MTFKCRTNISVAIIPPLDRNIQWLSSIAASILAAVSIFLGGVVVPAIKKRNISIIRTTIVAMVIWYPIRSIGSPLELFDGGYYA